MPDGQRDGRQRGFGGGALRPVPLLLGALGVLLLVAVFVWPTRYAYDDRFTVPQRTDRMTGEVQFYVERQWIDRDDYQGTPEYHKAQRAFHEQYPDLQGAGSRK